MKKILSSFLVGVVLFTSLGLFTLLEVKLQAVAAWVQHKHNVATAGVAIMVMGSNVTAGNTLIASVISASATATYSIVDDNGNTYTPSSISNTKVQYWCASNAIATPNANLNTTITSTDTSAAAAGSVREYSGLSCTFDGGTGRASITAITPIISDSITTTCTDVLVSQGSDPVSATDHPTAGWTNGDEQGGAVNYTWADKIGATAGSYNASFDNTSTGTTWYASIGAYKVTGGACSSTQAGSKLLFGFGK